MFWSEFYNLCEQRGVETTEVVESFGLSPAVCATWKDGLTPNVELLIKIADYFDVSVDYLVGREYNSIQSIYKDYTCNALTSKSSRSKSNFYADAYNDIIKHLNSLPLSERYRAIADIIDLLDKKYPLYSEE